MATIKDVKIVCSWYNFWGPETLWAWYKGFGELIHIVDLGGYDGAQLAEVHRTRSWDDLEHGRITESSRKKVISLAGSFRGETGLGVIFNKRFYLTIPVWFFLPHVSDRKSVAILQGLVGRGNLPVNFNWKRKEGFKGGGEFREENFQVTPQAYAEYGHKNPHGLIQTYHRYGFDALAIDLGHAQHTFFGDFHIFWNIVKNYVSSVHVPYERRDLKQPHIKTSRTREMLREIRKSGWPSTSMLPEETVFQIVTEARPDAAKHRLQQTGQQTGFFVTPENFWRFHAEFTNEIRQDLGKRA